MKIAKGGYNAGGVAHARNCEALERDTGMNPRIGRARYSTQQKIEIVAQAQIWMEETGISLSVAAANIKKISKSMLSRWVSQLPVLMKVREEEREYGRRQGSGRTSQLENVKDDILGFIEEYRLMGFAISKKMLVFQATRLKKDDGSSFSLNTYGARLQVVSRWMTQNRLTVRAGTHQAQADPEQTTSQVLDFILNIARPAILPGLPSRDRRFILNMDQTPVFFSCMLLKLSRRSGKKLSIFVW